VEDARQKQERAFWDGYAKHYDALLSRLRRDYGQILDTARGHVSSTTDVLEIATGTGAIAIGIADRARFVEACDISPEMIAVAQRKLSEDGPANVRFRVQDAYELDYPDAAFDVVIASNVLHVMVAPERTLASIARVMRPGSILLAPTYCHGDTVLSHLVSRLMSLRGFRAHHRWSVPELQAFLNENGFDIIEWQVVKGPIPLALPVLRRTE